MQAHGLPGAPCAHVIQTKFRKPNVKTAGQLLGGLSLAENSAASASLKASSCTGGLQHSGDAWLWVRNPGWVGCRHQSRALCFHTHQKLSSFWCLIFSNPSMACYRAVKSQETVGALAPAELLISLIIVRSDSHVSLTGSVLQEMT